MRKIIIENFGPIKKVSLDISKTMNVIIGPQASGKSTIAKAIYFCRKTRDYLIEFLMDSNNFSNTHPNELYVNFLKFVRKNFMGFFGTTKHIKPFKIQYFYNEETKTNIHLNLNDDGYAKIMFSSDLSEYIKKLLNDANKIHKDLLSNNSISFLEKYNEEARILTISQKHFTEIAFSIFYDREAIIYIPAGRSILSTFSEQLYDVNVTLMDTTMQEFVGLTRTTRNKFNNKLSEIVANYTKTVKGQINNNDVELAIEIISKVLKGDYVCDKDGEKIYYDVDRWVKLMFASSGQQESLWSLMLMFTFILEQRAAFIVLEEPEAHLFPEAQKYVVELIALFCTSTQSSILLTTHSPYVLTSINLLMHSFIVENNKKVEGENKIIPRSCRLNPLNVGAGIIVLDARNNIENIKDKETGLIDAYAIDRVSQIINEDTDKLIDLEIKYGL
ncbi:MAG: AAA family ATPase [Clostridiales bacterium]|nr:AAA family ATPase [Clostridiales bacterium]